jgi:hypothetical protein
VQVDISGIAAGTVANLSFDLIGFGRGAAAASSHVGVRDLRLDLPLRAGDDSAASAEDSPVEIDVLGNDQGVAAGVAPVPVAGPAHGALSVTADNRLRYTPAANWHGADSFTYRLSDGVSESNVATVSVTVSPANDAPGAAGAAYTLAQGGSRRIDLAGRVATDGAVSGLGRRQVEDRVVPCVASKISRR